MSISKKIGTLAMLGSLSVVLGYVELLFPLPVSIYGVKLGLANITVLLALFLIDEKSAVAIMFIKIFITSLLFLTPTMFFYSLTGGIFSVIAMIILKRFSFNVITTSIGGGILHNIGQLTAAVIILKNINVLYYLPVLIIAGTVMATATGICAKIIIKQFNQNK